ITIINKIDNKGLTPYREGNCIYLSARNKQGIDLLSENLKEHAGINQNTEGLFIARRRHLNALLRAQAALEKALEQIQVYQAGEFAAEECKIAQNALSEITGEFTSDDLLGEIFASFCIGK